MRKALVLGSVTAMAVGLTLAAAPANAAAGDTLVTFAAGTLGGLSISPGLYVPGAPGTNVVTGTMASVVTDLRGTNAGWIDAASSTNFSLVGATTAQTSDGSMVDVGAAAVSTTGKAKLFSTALLTSVPGTATITNTHTTLGSALSLSRTPATLLTAATANVNVTALTNTLEIDTTGLATGVFTGTVTQTVS
jgi:hypothetical protein